MARGKKQLSPLRPAERRFFPPLSPALKEMVVGTLLGDASLEIHGLGARMQVKHSVNLRPYFEWKRDLFSPLVPGAPHRNENKGYPFWRFVTARHPDLDDLYQSFYGGGHKSIPLDIASRLTSAQALAVWVMDDGHRSRDAVVLNTQSFSSSDLTLLQDMLARNFGLTTTRNSPGRGRSGERLYFAKTTAAVLCEMIRPHMIPEMQYKLPA